MPDRFSYSLLILLLTSHDAHEVNAKPILGRQSLSSGILETQASN